MGERTRAATYEDVLGIVKLFEREGVEYALIRGYALLLMKESGRLKDRADAEAIRRALKMGDERIAPRGPTRASCDETKSEKSKTSSLHPSSPYRVHVPNR